MCSKSSSRTCLSTVFCWQCLSTKLLISNNKRYIGCYFDVTAFIVMTFAANSCFVVLRQAACVGGIFLFRQSIVSRFINIASNFPEHEEKSNWPEVPFFFPGFWIAFSVPRICTTVPFPVGKVSFYISSIMLCTPFGMLLNNSITPCALVVLQEVNSLTYFSLGKWLFCSCWLNLPNFDSFFAELFISLYDFWLLILICG